MNFGRFGGGRFSSGRFAGGIDASIRALNPLLWLDPSDMSTLFQDAAATIPVTASGHHEGAMLDKSGNGYHAVQSVNDNYRMTFQETGDGRRYLHSDGIDDEMTTPALPFSSDATIVMAIRLNSYSHSFPEIFENRGGGSSGPHHQHPLVYAGSSSNGLRFRWGDHFMAINPGPSVIGLDIVASSWVSGLSMHANVNGVEDTRTVVSPISDGGSGGFTISAGNHADMRFYGVALFDRRLSDAELAIARSYFAQKSGGIA